MKNLGKKIGYHFNNIKLLELAMSHTSYANEVKGIMKTYQVSYEMTKEELLEYLSKSDVS